jgi:hypothetical protein
MVLELENSREEREGEMVNRTQALALTCRACVFVSFSFTCNHIK